MNLKKEKNNMIYSKNYSSPIGEILIVSDEENITGLWFKGQKYFGSTLNNEEVLQKDLPVLIKASNWLDDYFNGKNPKISNLALKTEGTSFRENVWKILQEIPYGETISYGKIAQKLSKDGKMSAQAVGGAVGHNPISIIIPCHRVVGSDGSLTGYAGGIDKKIKLLTHENVDISKFKS